MKKEKFKLPNGLTIFVYETVNVNKSSGNERKFKCIDIKEGRKFVLSLYKCYEKNGQPFEGNWGY